MRRNIFACLSLMIVILIGITPIKGMANQQVEVLSAFEENEILDADMEITDTVTIKNGVTVTIPEGVSIVVKAGAR